MRTLTNTTPRHKTPVGKTATQNLIPFLITVREGRVTVWAGGKNLFTADPREFGYDLTPEGMLQFGGILLYEQNTYSIEDLEIRSNSEAE